MPSELTWQAQEELAGGSANDDGMFGDWIANLGNLFVPAKSAETQGKHYKQMINLLESINRRLVNAFPGYIYKADTDTDAQYSVRPFKIKRKKPDGTYEVCAYAGENAKALTAAATNYIYADLTALPAITVTKSTVSFPATAHLELAIITAPASGPWKLQHIERRAHVHAIGVPMPGSIGTADLGDAVADEIMKATVSAGAEAANVIRVTCQVKDAQGNNLAGVRRVEWNLSDTASSASETAQAPTVAYVNGAAWQSITANKKAVAFTDANGALVLDVTLAGDLTIHAVFSVGGKVYSQALDFN